MTLLTQILERPLDPGYAAAAAKRVSAGLPASTSIRRPLPVVAAVLVGLLLASSALALRAPTTAASSAKKQLIAEIDSRRAQGDALTRRIATLSTDISAIEASALQAQRQQGLATQVQELSLLTGSAAVTGPGVTLTIDDATSVTDGSGSGAGGADDTAAGAAGSGGSAGDTTTAQDQGTVMGRDLQIVVNGLWQSGAEAIAVNGQRLTARSAIRFAGAAILVDYRPLTRPYVVAAIGSTDGLQTAFAASSAGAYLRSLGSNYGIQSSVTGSSALTLPAAAALTLHSATPTASETAR